MNRILPTCTALATVWLASTASAQSAGFVMTLGTDTVQVEQFRLSGNTITGVVATRTPASRLLRYTIMLDANGRFAKYEQTQSAGDGTRLANDPGKGTLTYLGDTIVRDVMQKSEPLTQRIAAPAGAFPLSTIPVGMSFLVFEYALAAARSTPLDAQPALYRLMAAPFGTAPSRTRVLYTAPDSVEVDYFGQGRMGFKFDHDGRLIRSDWRGTTYKDLIVRVNDIDAEAYGRRWAAQDAAGAGFGALSVRDSVSARVDAASLWVTYSRPARRGRVIWGGVVPWNTVWRLGADFATQFGTDTNLLVGGTPVPAGKYTLWMLPSPDGSLLIINKQTGIFGTQYNPANDFARIPLRREAMPSNVERLTVGVDGGQLRIEWGDARYTVPIKAT